MVKLKRQVCLSCRLLWQQSKGGIGVNEKNICFFAFCNFEHDCRM